MYFPEEEIYYFLNKNSVLFKQDLKNKIYG